MRSCGLGSAAVTLCLALLRWLSRPILQRHRCRTTRSAALLLLVGKIILRAGTTSARHRLDNGTTHTAEANNNVDVLCVLLDIEGLEPSDCERILVLVEALRFLLWRAG